jgi:hypothetical protein
MTKESDSAANNRRLALVSVVIALLSLVASVVQNVNYLRSIDSMQRNILRTESLRTCRDLIDTFFRFRLKAEAVQLSGSAGMNGAELKALAYQFGGLGTFLANFHPDAARARYSALAWQLNTIAEKAGSLPKDAFDALFVEADRQFATINDDCVKAATGHLL